MLRIIVLPFCDIASLELTKAKYEHVFAYGVKEQRFNKKLLLDVSCKLYFHLFFLKYSEHFEQYSSYIKPCKISMVYVTF